MSKIETKHMMYVGPDCGWNVTKGLTALVKDSTKPEKVLVQFDDYYVQRNGVDLCFGWHEFLKEHFVDIKE